MNFIEETNNLYFYTRIKEKELLEKIRNEDTTALVEFINLNLPYVLAFIENKKFKCSLEDAIKMGNAILQDSIIKFAKLNLDMPFNSYLRQALSKTLKKYILEE